MGKRYYCLAQRNIIVAYYGKKVLLLILENSIVAFHGEKSIVPYNGKGPFAYHGKVLGKMSIITCYGGIITFHGKGHYCFSWKKGDIVWKRSLLLNKGHPDCMVLLH